MKKVDTVTLKDLAASLAETHSLPKAQANTMLTEMVANVGKHLKKGSRIRIGVGVLLFLGLLIVFTWRLNAAYWKNVT